MTETPDGLNRLTQQNVTALSYDARGNAVLIGSASYGYTSENRLTQAGANYLAYDALGRLFSTSGGGGSYRDYAGDALIREATTAGPVRRYVHGDGADEPLVWYEGTGLTDRRWLLADERGSVVAVTDGAGVATSINRYDDYGVPASGNAGRFGYTGQTWLPELGMWHYKARVYAPTLGRFMQTDPIGYAGGINLYAYVGGDPINLVDSSGAFGLPTCYQQEIFHNRREVDEGTGRIVAQGTDGSTILRWCSIPENSLVNGEGSGDGGGAGSASSGATAERLRGMCRVFEDATSAAVSRASLPSYVTDNKNWTDVSTLQGYQNLYQSNLDQWNSLGSDEGNAVSGVAIQGALSLVPQFRALSMARQLFISTGSTYSFSKFVSGQKSWNLNNIKAIHAGVTQLRGGC